MASQSGKQTIITIHILSNISGSKGNRIMKFGQLADYNKRKIFVQNFGKTLCEVKASGL